MKVTVYDKNPGVGAGQWFLKTSWLVGCWLQKLFGKVDAWGNNTVTCLATKIPKGW